MFGPSFTPPGVLAAEFAEDALADIMAVFKALSKILFSDSEIKAIDSLKIAGCVVAS
jgi:hypothetical protein